ncbi:g11295 [Coccomyxa elongata]
MWQGGEGSTAAGLCFDAKVPRNADFITMEFTLNDADYAVPFAVEYLHSMLDWPRDMLSDNRKGFEVLLRNAMLHPNQPALLYIHEWVAPFEGFSFWLSDEADMSTFLQYYRYYADVMVAFLQDHAYAAATGPSTGPPTGPPHPLPAPLIPSNYEHGSQCAINEALITLVQPSQGWEWVDEGKLGHHKLGWRSVTPGSKLITKPMDTTSTVQNSSEPVLLILGILKSYEHMGQAVLACESGCTCKPLKFDGHHTIKESVTKQARGSFSPLPFLSSQDKELFVFMVIGKTTSRGP